MSRGHFFGSFDPTTANGRAFMDIEGAVGTMTLMSKAVSAAQPKLRVMRLEASIDGTAVILTDVDLTGMGISREVCYRITVADLVSAIEVHGVEQWLDSLSR
jgi:hypothetical protein